jgi:hypothetical protein
MTQGERVNDGISEDGKLGDLAALTSALDHAGSMTQQAQEVRMRNFSFFVVIIGALVARYGRSAWTWNLICGVAGIAASLLFLGLDLRGLTPPLDGPTGYP